MSEQRDLPLMPRYSVVLHALRTIGPAEQREIRHRVADQTGVTLGRSSVKMALMNCVARGWVVERGDGRYQRRDDHVDE